MVSYPPSIYAFLMALSYRFALLTCGQMDLAFKPSAKHPV